MNIKTNNRLPLGPMFGDTKFFTVINFGIPIVQQVNLSLQKVHSDYSNLLNSIVNIISILSTFQGPKGKNRLPLGTL